MGYQRGWRATLVADRDVGLPRPQVDQGVRAVDVEIDFGVHLAPERQARHQPAVCKRIGGRQPQRRRTLCFTGDPLRAPLELIGAPLATLDVLASALPLHLVVKLSAVAPHGNILGTGREETCIRGQLQFLGLIT